MFLSKEQQTTIDQINASDTEVNPVSTQIIQFLTTDDEDHIKLEMLDRIKPELLDCEDLQDVLVQQLGIQITFYYEKTLIKSLNKYGVISAQMIYPSSIGLQKRLHERLNELEA